MQHSLGLFLKPHGAKHPRFTQEQFAKRVGLAQGSISKFLSGKIRQFDREVAERIVKETGGEVTLDDLLIKTPYFVKRAGKRARQ